MYHKTQVMANGDLLAEVYTPNGERPTDGTTFLTGVANPVQVGLIHRSNPSNVKPHRHAGLRCVEGCPETLLVVEGGIKVTVYDSRGNFASEHHLSHGAFIILLSGHAVEFTAGTTVLEFKQGPYYGPDKEPI